MHKENSKEYKASKPACKGESDFKDFSHRILDFANDVIPRVEFLRGISKMLLHFSQSDVVELWLRKNGNFKHCVIDQKTEHTFQYDTIVDAGSLRVDLTSNNNADSLIDLLIRRILQGAIDRTMPIFTPKGSFHTGNAVKSLLFLLEPEEQSDSDRFANNIEYFSIIIIELKFGIESIGFIQLMSKNEDHFTEKEIGLYEDLAQTIGIAIVNQRTQAALRERVKELTCLYNIGKLAGQESKTHSEILQDIVDLIPPAWQYPEVTEGRITFDGNVYKTSGFQKLWQTQLTDIIVKGVKRGTVEVVYTKLKPSLDEGPFLTEEKKLLELIAGQVSLIVENWDAQKDSLGLQQQLRHADRLATIGQLAAGVAHELNEPLGNILGFAQLTQKSQDLPVQAEQDIDKIVKASLYAREVIKKLMLFSRQMPSQTSLLQLNKIVNEGLYFFEARCEKAGIELIRRLHPDIPKITGDQAQLNQVLVNLVVNAIQAMPNGGKLIVVTSTSVDHISLLIEDSGIGMNEDVLQKLFIPFFTTKDIDEGTGLGLAVVHGIVTSHKG
ncbi:MAG: hypothetical protein GY855_17490, partial [candidate division Zixibacteria bacterium]|nr:hypothetical protein [candidate division Zixibacteria bacterium]